jgi:hypothetical protein
VKTVVMSREDPVERRADGCGIERSTSRSASLSTGESFRPPWDPEDACVNIVRAVLALAVFAALVVVGMQ